MSPPPLVSTSAPLDTGIAFYAEPRRFMSLRIGPQTAGPPPRATITGLPLGIRVAYQTDGLHICGTPTDTPGEYRVIVVLDDLPTDEMPRLPSGQATNGISFVIRVLPPDSLA